MFNPNWYFSCFLVYKNLQEGSICNLLSNIQLITNISILIFAFIVLYLIVCQLKIKEK